MDMSKVVETIDPILSKAGFEREDEVSEGAVEVVYSGRGNGNGTDCEIDSHLIEQARGVRKKLMALGYVVKVDNCDEWLYLAVGGGDHAV
jgi:hypothetical protein